MGTDRAVSEPKTQGAKLLLIFHKLEVFNHSIVLQNANSAHIRKR